MGGHYTIFLIVSVPDVNSAGLSMIFVDADVFVSPTINVSKAFTGPASVGKEVSLLSSRPNSECNRKRERLQSHTYVTTLGGMWLRRWSGMAGNRKVASSIPGFS